MAHYVPNLTIGPVVLKSLRPDTVIPPIGVHAPDGQTGRPLSCPTFAAAGAGIVHCPEPPNMLTARYGC